MTLFDDPFLNVNVVAKKETVTVPSDSWVIPISDGVGIPHGIFTVVLPDLNRITIKIKPGRNGHFSGISVASYLNGPNNDSDYEGFANANGRVFKVWRRNRSEKAVTALRFLCGDQDNQELSGMLYAVESSNCWRCGRTLTVPASIHMGLGPECAKKV